jgi:WD40 repeat protein/uncharacterized caspase-like protein
VTAGPAGKESQGKWAVIIGVNQYPGGATGLNPLEFAANDAREVRTVLIQEFGYQEDHIHYLPDKKATLQAMRDAFTNWLPGRKLNADDSVMVFFAGHGLVDWNDKAQEGYLAAVDSDGNKLAETCLPVTWVRDQMAARPCQQKLLILDCCYSGKLFQKYKEVVGKGDAFFGMSAGKITPVADGRGKDGHSIFTSALLQELRARANSPRSDHRFTFGEFAPLVKTRVETDPKSRQVPGRQDPEWGRLADGEGDFWFRPTQRRPTRGDRQAMQDYAARLAQAELVRRADNVVEANRLLDACPESLRHWEWRYLKRLSHTMRLKFQGHNGVVNCLAYNPTGTRLASASGDKSVKIWDVTTGRELHTLTGHTGEVFCVAYSPDGTRLASGSADQSVRLWDAETGKEIATLQPRFGPVKSLAFDPKRPRLAVAGGPAQEQARPIQPGVIQIWDTTTAKLIRGLTGHTSQVCSVAYSPDGTRLASASPGGSEPVGMPGMARTDIKDPEAKVWNADTGQELLTFRGHKNAIKSVAFSPDGQRIASASGNEAIKVWEATTGKELVTIPYPGYINTTNVAFSGDGTRLAAGMLDWTVRIWDAINGKESMTLRGQGDYANYVTFSPDSQSLASVVRSPHHGTFFVWDIRAGREARVLASGDRYVFGLAFNPKRPHLAAASLGAPLRGWDLVTGKEVFSFPEVRATGLQYTPDGDHLAVYGGNSVLVLDLVSKQVRPFMFPPLKGTNVRRYASATVAVSPDGCFLAAPRLNPATPGANGEVLVWDARSGQRLHTFPLKGAFGTAVVFSHNSRVLVLASSTANANSPEKGLFQFWDLKIGRDWTLATQTGHVRAVAFSPDGQWLATGSVNGKVILWRLPFDLERHPLTGHTDVVTALAFSTDSRRLVSASFDNTAKLWDVLTGQEVFTVQGHTDKLRSAAISADGEWLATASLDGTVKSWDGRPLQTAPIK